MVEEAVNWAIGIAQDGRYGYDQANRWGPDYDCSSFVITAYEKAGAGVKAAGATYTGNMKPVFLRCGFEDVTADVGLSTGGGLARGDVLLNIVNHTAMYIGNGQIVQASINEKGTITGGQTGDQTGGEIAVRSYYNYPWDCVLRYTGGANTGGGGGTENAPESATGANTYAVYLPMISNGMTGSAVLSLQCLLIHKWAISCGSCGADGEFGTDTETAVRTFQRVKGLEIDGIVGPDTWTSILYLKH